MRLWMVGLLVLLVLIVALRLFSRSGNVDSKGARDLVSQGATLVDVRSPEEFRSGHIDGAVNIPVGELAGKLAQIPRDKPVVVYCRSGARSARAAGTLQASGYTQVYDLGGMSNW